MTDDHARAADPDEAAREKGRLAADAAILRMAGAAGVQIHERPVLPGAATTMHGHADGCARFAAVVAEYDRQLQADEHEFPVAETDPDGAADNDPGPETGDVGGMSEFVPHHPDHLLGGEPYDCSGAWDGRQVISDADPGL